MTKEELMEMLGSEEGKALFSEVVKERGFVSPEEVSTRIESEVNGLKSKRDELLAEITSKKEKVQFASKIEEILKNTDVDAGQLEDLLYKAKHPEATEDMLEIEREKKRVSRENQTLATQLKELNEQFQAKEKELSDKDSYLGKVLIDGAFKDAFGKVEGLDATQMEILLPYIIKKSGAIIERDDLSGEYKAVTDDGRSISKYVDWWKDTDQGKSYRNIPNSVGGGSTGSVGIPMNKAFKDMSFDERDALYKKDKDLYRRLKDNK